VAFEHCCARLLPTSDGDHVVIGRAQVKIARDNPGQIDVFVRGSGREILILECKSAGMQRYVSAAGGNARTELGNAVDQVNKRVDSFVRGTPITVDEHTFVP
jgi:hypothetical protein